MKAIEEYPISSDAAEEAADEILQALIADGRSVEIVLLLADQDPLALTPDDTTENRWTPEQAEVILAAKELEKEWADS